MSYRCDICGIKVPPKHPRLVFQEVRQNRIVKELPACEVCLALLRLHGIKFFQDPYYLRPKTHEKVIVEVAPPTQPERPPLSAEEIGKPAKNATL